MSHTIDVIRRTDTLHSIRAIARWIYWRHVRGYRYEICHDCGRPVGRGIGSYWSAPDQLWLTIMGHEGGILCPRCFTVRADTYGIFVHWEASVGEAVRRLTGNASNGVPDTVDLGACTYSGAGDTKKETSGLSAPMNERNPG